MFSASLIRLVRDEAGASAVEYGLLVGMIALVLVATVNGIGSSVDQIMTFAGSDLKLD
jgi:pilus assembly protein Flp/PilA